MESKTQRIILETSRHRISGELTMPKEGYRSRISDFLNRSDLDFIPLSNASIRDLRDEHAPPIERDFIAVAASHVHLAYPDD
jgi:hypothetical protein